MQGNPFYIDPLGGYGKEITRGLTGLGAVLGERQQMKQEQAQEQEDLQEMQTLLRSGQPGQVADFILRKPKLAQRLTTSVTYLNDQTQQNAYDTLKRIEQGEDPVAALSERLMFLEQNGADPTDTIKELQSAMDNPEQYMQTAGRKREMLFPQRYLQELQIEAEKRRLTQPQIELTGTQKEYQLAKAEGFEGSFLDYQKALKGGPDSDVRTMMLQTQLLDLQDRIGERQRKEDSLTSLEDKKAKSLIKGIDSVVEEVDKAVKLAKEGTLATGIPGAITSKVPGSPAYNLRKRLDTVKANLGFDKLQQMRDSSPTGGALGSITDRELDLLQATLTNLDPNMGDEELIAGLEKVKKHYDTWRDAVTGGVVNVDQGTEQPPAQYSNQELEQAAKRLGISVQQLRQDLGL